MTTPDLAAPTPAQVEGSGLLLELVRSGRTPTVTQMATAVGVSRSTVGQRLGLLEKWGLVAAEVRLVGARGRPAAATRFRTEGGSVLAAHVGVTGYRAAVTDLAAETLADRYVDLDLAAGPDVLLGSLTRTFRALRRSAKGPLTGIGVGIPSLLELRALHREEDAEWSLDVIRTTLEARFEVPVHLDLDVNLLALAEHRASWSGTEVLVCLKLGTSVDASVVVRGEPLRGRHGLAGELGHVRVAGQDTPCTCGSRGCVEAVASGAALVRRLHAEGHEVEHVRDVVRLAAEGDRDALQAVREAGRHIGSTLASVVTLLNPGAITAWGYLTESEQLFAGIREALYAGALAVSAEGLVLERTTLGPLAGVRGAALRVLDEVLAPDAIDRVLVARSWAPAS